MSDVAKLKLPNGTTIYLKDEWARTQIEGLSGFTKYLGVTTTELTDGSATNPITINGASVTATNGNIVLYGNSEFIFDGSNWNQFGDLSALGSLAYKNSASGSYTPSGSVAAPTITVASAGSTTTIKNPTKATVALSVSTAAPGATAPTNPVTVFNYDSTNETLELFQVGYTTGDSISTSDVSVKTGDASYSASAPSFTGSSSTITVS